MSRFTTAALLMAAFATASIAASAQQATPKFKTTAIERTSVTSGPQMYTTYCAVCHGVNGTGNGPAAQALKTPPANLTALSQKNGGSFPANHVSSVLKFGVENPAHGSAEMPSWRDAMSSLHSSRDNESLLHLRILNLTNYLKQMQK
jgi:mono/diheme cytochrome c family protein